MGPFSSVKYMVLWHSQSMGDVKLLPEHDTTPLSTSRLSPLGPLLRMGLPVLHSQLCRVLRNRIYPDTESLSPLCGNKDLSPISSQAAHNLWPCPSIPGGPSGISVLSLLDVLS